LMVRVIGDYCPHLISATFSGYCSRRAAHVCMLLCGGECLF